VRILDTLRARDPRAAARSAVLILAVCTGVLTGLNTFQNMPPWTFAWVASWLGVLVLALAAGACMLIAPERLDRVAAGALIAVGGIVLVCALNLLTGDTSAAAQAFLAFPVLWVASHMRRGAVVLVTGMAVLADGVTLFLLIPAAQAATDFVFFGAVLVVMAVMLVRASATQERLVEALQEQARVDSLTGLVNRRVFDEALETSLTRPVRAGTALVLIDVDAFKTINDRHGHPVGDDVLVHLAGVLREQVRVEDAVLSRLGGDELAVLLPGCTVEVARRRAEELLEAVRSNPLFLPDGTLLALSISLGVAHMPRQAGKLRTLYHAADAALYDAKRSGRGRVAVAAV
jgi:diguanylate cyclase (GGDEF)-like protein